MRVLADRVPAVQVRHVAERYVETNGQFDADDSFFTFHVRVGVPDGEPTDAREIDEDLYGEG